MYRVGIALVAALSFGAMATTSTARTLPMPVARPRPYDSLFRGQMKPDQQNARVPQVPELMMQREPTAPPIGVNGPVCMPTFHGDASLDSKFLWHTLPNGPTPSKGVYPAPPCVKSVR